MEQLNKVNQDNMLLRKAHKKKVKQNKASIGKAKTSTFDTGTKATKVGNNQGNKREIMTRQLRQ